VYTRDNGGNTLPNKWLPFLKEMIGQPITVLEIGSFEGMSTVWMLENLLTHPESKILCLDPFEANPEFYRGTVGNYLGAFQENVAPFKEKVIIIQKRSQLAKQDLEPYRGKLSLAYIDGSHECQDVFYDALLCAYLVKPGGLIIFDDIPFDGVRKAVDDFIPQCSSDFEILHKEPTQWLFKRKISSESDKNSAPRRSRSGTRKKA